MHCMLACSIKKLLHSCVGRQMSLGGGNRCRAHHHLSSSRVWALHQPGRSRTRKPPCTPAWQSTQQRICTASSHTFHLQHTVRLVSNHCAASRMYAFVS